MGSLGLHPMTLVVVGIYVESHTTSMDNVGRDWRGSFLGQLVRVGHGEMCGGSLGLACDLQKAFGYSPWTSLCFRPKGGYHGHLRATA